VTWRACQYLSHQGREISGFRVLRRTLIVVPFVMAVLSWIVTVIRLPLQVVRELEVMGLLAIGSHCKLLQCSSPTRFCESASS